MKHSHESSSLSPDRDAKPQTGEISAVLTTTAATLTSLSAGRRASNKGIALITVLTIVTLATILVLTFFTLARNELVASVNYSDGLHAKHLSETAINMVIGQIRRATADTDRVWACQPGAIRTYDGTSGQFDAGYKLYSSGNMVERSAGPSGEGNLVNEDYAKLKTWSTELWRFADLNEPVIRGDRIYYPVVDPRARDFPKWDDAREFDDAGVEGFDWHTTGMADSPMKDALGEIIDPLTRSPHKALPMPVEWIYQLEDGTLGRLDNNKKFIALGTGGAATKLNPIIGRIAFWADDETCKTNVNVHAGGTAWDTPRAGGDIDRNLGRYQPAQHEWQRYPGHPATTSLAPVLFPGMKNITLNRDAMEKIFRLVPRVVGGGSSSGTRAVNPNDPKEANGLIADKDRLYPSLDDFILTPGGGRGYDHTAPKISYGTRDNNEFPRLDSGQEVDELLEVSRFFLTVSSRAPEVNLFNQPRVSIWPTYYATNDQDRQYRLTPFDRAIRFCSSLGQNDNGEINQYYFQRENADSTTSDWDNIPRNKEVYAYLDRLTKRNIPGYGSSFEKKYGTANRIQLLTMMFDYIRSSNIFDDTVYDYASPDNPNSWKAAYKLENDAKHLTYTNYRTQSERGLHMGYGQVTPIHIDYNGIETKGMGRFYTIDEVALQLICNAEGPRTDTGIPGANGKGPYDVAMSLGPRRAEPVPGEGATGAGAFVWSNVPPMHPGFQPADPASATAPLSQRETWPKWYERLFDAGATEMVTFVNDEKNWNWMLAYNHRDYRENIIESHKYTEKFSREWITRDMVQDPDFVAVTAKELAEASGNPTKDRLRLGPDQKMIQGVLLMEVFSPSAGFVPIKADMKIEVDTNGLTFYTAEEPDGSVRQVVFNKVDHPYGISTGSEENTWVSNWHDYSAVWGGRHNGGGGGFRALMRSTRGILTPSGSLTSAGNRGDVAKYLRPYGATQTVATNGNVDANGEQVAFGGWDAGRRVWFDRSALASAPFNGTGEIDASNLYPFVTLPFRAGRDVVNVAGLSAAANIEIKIYSNRGFAVAKTGPKNDIERFNSAPQPVGGASTAEPELVQRIAVHMRLGDMPTPWLATGTKERRNEFKAVYNEATSPMRWWSAGYDGPNPLSAPLGRMASSNRSPGGGDGESALNGNYIRDGDTVWGWAAEAGDQRVTASKRNLSTNDPRQFRRHPDASETTRLAHTLTTADGGRSFSAKDANLTGDYITNPKLKRMEGANQNYSADEITDLKYPKGKQPLPIPVKGEREKGQLFGDFDNGMGGTIDGAFVNKVDEGNTHSLRKRTVNQTEGSWEWRRDYGSYPYFVREWTHEPSGPSFFSPNRMMPSPVMFGSMPSEIVEDVSGLSNKGSWQTFLFRPNVVGNGYTSHPGAASPPDHMLLDLFWMPVVEPYVISEPSSTAGRVNMNYQILPFKNITRTSALRGVFQSEYMLCIPNYHVINYKVGVGRGRRYHWLYAPFDGELQRLSLRSVIVEDATLDQFEDKFRNNEIYLTASEICDVHLIPQDIGEKQGFANRTGTFTPTLEQMQNGLYWSKHKVVGDNGREAPYAHIYPRLTTKSNTFNVHVRSQVLKKARETEPDQWDPELDTVVAEYRGSAIVERYIEARDPEIPDYVNDPAAPTLDQFYKFRVVNEKRFSP